MCKHVNGGMPATDKAIMKDFHSKLITLMDNFWEPDEDDMYWDKLLEAATRLLTEFTTKNIALNKYFSNAVAAFMNSREELLH